MPNQMNNSFTACIHVTQKPNGWYRAVWLTEHVTNGVYAEHPDGVPQVLQKLADRIEASERRRASLPD